MDEANSLAAPPQALASFASVRLLAPKRQASHATPPPLSRSLSPLDPTCSGETLCWTASAPRLGVPAPRSEPSDSQLQSPV